MSVFSNNLLLGAGGQSTGGFDPTLIGNSVWLDGSADYLSKTPGSTGNQKRFTFAFWVQRNKFGEVAPGLYSAGDGTQNNDFNIYWNNSGGGGAAGDILCISQINGGGVGWRIFTSQVFRDIGWYHFIISVDTAESNAADRVSIYLNGVQITSFASASYPSLNADVDYVNDSANEQRIGRNQGSNYIDGYLAQYLFLDGDSIQNGDVAVTDILDAFTFGTNGSQFVPKSDADIAALATTAGGNSFCLDFADSADLGNDISSNANDFTATSMAAVNQSTNTPSLEFPVLNVLNGDATLVAAMEYGNRLGVGVGDWDSVFATKSMGSSGKYYYEVRMHTETGANGFIAGIHEENTTSKNWASYIGNTTSTYGLGYSLYTSVNGFYTNGSPTAITGYTSNLVVGDIVMMAVDLDNNKLYWGVNGTFFNSGDPASGTGESTTIQADTEYVFGTSPSSSEDYFVNFGADSTFGGTTTTGGNTDANGVGNFKYTVPTGFQCLASSSLSAPDYQGIDYFAPTLYEGNGTGQRVGDFVPFTDSTTIANSIIFNDDDTAYLNRTFVTPTSANKFTFAFWIKCGSSTSDQYIFSTGTTNGTEAYIHLNHSTGGGQLWIADPNDGVGWGVKTDRKILDSSSWTHICLSVDSTADSGSRFAIEINGVTATTTAFGAAEPSASQSLNFMTATAKNIGRRIRTSSAYFDGYLSDVYFIDGEKLAASNFAQLDTSTNRWVPKAYSGSYGNNGFKLAFGTAPGTGSGAGTDTSGEGHNWTENNFGTNDQVVDTPSKNFTTFDPGYSGGGSNVWTEGNTKVKGTDGSLSDSSTTTFGMTGKVVFQFQMNTVLSGYPQVGFITSQTGLSAINAASGSIEMGTASVPGSFAYTDTGIFKIPGGTESTTFSSVSSLQALDADDVLRFEVDTDAGTVRVYFQDEGTGSFTEITGARVDNFSFDPSFGIRPAVSNYNNSIVTLQTGGQTTLASVTTDYKEINQDNLDDTASKITAWAWIKNRDATDSHVLVDRVRGVGEVLHSNETAAEATEPNTVQRFLQRGVQVGSDVQVNTANESYVLWQWLLGDSATTGSTTSPAGTIASTSIAADAGHLSIGTYTGTGANGTVGHGLTAAPEFVNVKQLNSTASWSALIPALGNSNAIYLNLSNAAQSVGTAYWQNTDPTSSVFSIGTDNAVNGSSSTYLFQCFRSVPGVCKIGSYIGNGNANGPYISVGFKPSFIMIKRSVGGTGDWNILDTSREPFNDANPLVLRANLTTADEAGSIGDFDILSDGFKIKAVSANANTASSTYIYIAMADIGGNGTLPPVYGR